MNANKRIAFAVALVMVLGPSSGARAQDPRASGEELFKQGRAAMSEENYQLAFGYFERSQKLDPALGTLLNMAVCEEKLGRIGSALGHMREALAQASPTDRRASLIAERIDALDKRIARLTLRPDTPLGPGVTVAIDGRPIDRAELGKALLLDPGAHELKCAGPHGELCAQSFRLTEGERAERPLVITLPSAPAPPVVPIEKRPVPPRPKPDSTFAYGLGGLGIAGLGVGLATGLAVIQRKNTVSEHCYGLRGCDQKAIDAAASGKTLSWVSTIATAVGVTALGTSAYLLLSAPTSKGSAMAISISGVF